MKHKKLSLKHLLGEVLNSKVRFPVLLPWGTSMRSSPLPFSICKSTRYSCFPAEADVPPGRSAPLPRVATCSARVLPKQRKPLALVGVAQARVSSQGWCGSVSSKVFGFNVCCFVQQCITHTAARVVNLGDWQLFGNGKKNVSKRWGSL